MCKTDHSTRAGGDSEFDPDLLDLARGERGVTCIGQAVFDARHEIAEAVGAHAVGAALETVGGEVLAGAVAAGEFCTQALKFPQVNLHEFTGALDAERPDGFDPARITHRTGVAYPVIGPGRGRQHRQRAQPAFGKAGKRGDPAFPSTTYSYSSIKL